MKKRYPLTSAEARKKRYGEWAGNPKGSAYVPGRCAYDCFSKNDFIPHQCSRRNGNGPDKLYCRQHAQIVEREVENEKRQAEALNVLKGVT